MFSCTSGGVEKFKEIALAALEKQKLIGNMEANDAKVKILSK
jgi:hypothetical protein